MRESAHTDGTDSRPALVMAHPSVDLYGSDRMLLESVRALKDEWRVVVVLPGVGPLTEELRAEGIEPVVLEVPVLRKSLASVSGALSTLRRTISALPPAVRLLRDHRAAACYVNTITVPTWLVAARIAGVPSLCHVHEAEHLVPRLVQTLLALPLLLARGIVANSQATESVLRQAIPWLRRRTRIVYNGIGPATERAPLREHPSPPAQLLLSGRLSPRKGTDVAVEAVAILRDRAHDVHLTLAGGVFPGYEWFSRELHALVRRHALTDHVRFAGFVPSVWTALAEADVVLMPSRVEPFGNAAVEAMLAGRPVIASDVQGLREILTDGVTGALVPPGRPDLLADAIEHLLMDWDGASRMAKRGQHSVEERFAPQTYANAISGAVRSLAPHRWVDMASV